MGIVELQLDGKRQLERATRLLDITQPRTPVHKSLEQLCAEARTRYQPGPLGLVPTGPAGLSRILQGPKAQKLDRDVVNFTLSKTGRAGLGGVASADEARLGVREFFAKRYDCGLLSVVEEAHRDCMRSLERHSFDRIQASWEDAKAQIVGTLAPHRFGHSGAALGAATPGGADITVARAAPSQDVAIITLLLKNRVTPVLVPKIGRLSCESCPGYNSELAECWGIVGGMLQSSMRLATCGALKYLQDRFAEDMKAVVYRLTDLQLGGVPDAWALVRAFGRIKYETTAFPSTTLHVWFAAYAAARAGFTHLLYELPDRAAPCADRCPMYRTVCTLMAKRLQATSLPGQAHEFSPSPDVDHADLRANLESNPFQDMMLCLLLSRSFAFGAMPDATVVDWLWYRLHAVNRAGGDNDSSPEFKQHLESLRQQTLEFPLSYYDPVTAGTNVPSNSLPGLGDALHNTVGSADVAQTLNFVKVLLLTGQFSHAIQQLRSQERCLHGPALHISLVLHRFGALEALKGPDEQAVNITSLVTDYAWHFGSVDQVQYLRVLDRTDRLEALQRLLLRGGLGTNDELLGYIDNVGQHKPGLLEQTMLEDGLGDQAEFVDLCVRAGRSACEHGLYREALRLFHLGKSHSEVLHVLCRCLRLPVWREATISSDVELLDQDIQRFFVMYERNLDRFALSSQLWAVARKLYATRQFHALSERGMAEAALDLFDREALLPLGGACDGEVLTEYPHIVSGYVRILQYAASRGVVVTSVLRARVRQLQSFLAVHSHRIVLDQETATSLASLAFG